MAAPSLRAVAIDVISLCYQCNALVKPVRILGMKGVTQADSVTHLTKEARGTVAVCGSHGGLYAAWLAARAGVRAVVLNDAGIGRNSAGIAGVLWLAGLGIPAVAIDHRSARIADGKDMLQSGIVSTVNEVAARHGCLPGHTCKQ